MYETLKKRSLNLDDLTTIIHFTIKILNKFKSVHSESTLSDIKLAPHGENYNLCKDLLNEIGIDNLRGNDAELDKHISNLYLFLQERMSKELNINTERGIELLKTLKN